MDSYKGLFYSVLTIPQYAAPIDTLDDLERAATSGEHTIVTMPNTFYYDMFADAQCCGAYYKIGERIKKAHHMPENTEAAIDMINQAFGQQKSVIFIYTSVSLLFAARTFAKIDMHVSSETLMMDQMAMALQKGSPLLNTMNKA